MDAAAALPKVLAQGVRLLEAANACVLGGTRRPLLVSVRSGAAVSMPGMMETVLDVGLNGETVEALIRQTGNPRLAWDSYRRFIQMYGSVVLGVDHHRFEEIIENAKIDAGVTEDTALSPADWQRVVSEYKDKKYRCLTGFTISKS